jgi:hypothetical protein
MNITIRGKKIITNNASVTNEAPSTEEINKNLFSPFLKYIKGIGNKKSIVVIEIIK